MRCFFACLTLLCLTACPVPLTVDAGVPKRDAGRPVFDAGQPQTEFNIVVEVKGLEGRGLVLRVNDVNDLTVTASGVFTFAQTLSTGEVYTVTVGVQPSAPTQTCTVENGLGTIDHSNITNVVVKCVTKRYAIGGTVVGLTGLGLTLRNNNADALSITKNGPFAFPITFPPDDPYAVTIFNQPVGPVQNCAVSGATGVVGNSDVASVVVNCSSSAHTVGGTISGLAGSVTLRNNGTDTLTLTANGSFAFGVPIESNKPYSVEIVTQPGPNSTCYVDQGIGVMGGSNITSVAITCTTATHFIGGTVSNLGFNPVVLTNNGTNALSISANGTFRFSTPIASGSTYTVRVGTQPTTQRCAVTRGTGTVDAIDITTVEVVCADAYTVGGLLTGATKPVTLRNNGEDLVVSQNTIFVFAQRLLPGETFSVSVKAQPSDGQSYCVVEPSKGQVKNSNVSVDVRCNRLGTSCANILAEHPGSVDGRYYIDPDGTGLLAPMEVTCDMTRDNGGWMLVTPEFVASIDQAQYVDVSTGLDPFGGVILQARANSLKVGTNCNINSWNTLYFEDLVPWSLVRSNWQFEGNATCWSIFGNVSEIDVALNVTPLASSDAIRQEIRMGGTGSDLFDGVTSRCASTSANFWAMVNGTTRRSAQVILRRSNSSALAGLGVGTSCAEYNNIASSIPTWVFSDIWLK